MYLRQVWVRIPLKAQALVARNHPLFQFLFTYLVIKFHYYFIYFVFISIQLNGNISLHHVISLSVHVYIGSTCAVGQVVVTIRLVGLDIWTRIR